MGVNDTWNIWIVIKKTHIYCFSSSYLIWIRYIGVYVVYCILCMFWRFIEVSLIFWTFDSIFLFNAVLQLMQKSSLFRFNWQSVIWTRHGVGQTGGHTCRVCWELDLCTLICIWISEGGRDFIVFEGSCTRLNMAISWMVCMLVGFNDTLCGDN